jgi:hypothetical protein
MKKLAFVALSVAMLASTGVFTNAYAQETRAQVRQELIQAEHDGSQYVTDASYPAVASIYENQIAKLRQDTSAMGGVASGSGMSGMAMHAATGKSKPDSCVGPASFCTPYFGS